MIIVMFISTSIKKNLLQSILRGPGAEKISRLVRSSAAWKRLGNDSSEFLKGIYSGSIRDLYGFYKGSIWVL